MIETQVSKSSLKYLTFFTMLLTWLGGEVLADTSDMRYGWTNVAGAPDGTVNDPTTAIDSYGNIFTFGEHKATADFDPSDGEDIYPCDFDCMFLSKYGPDGSYQWTQSWHFDDYSNPMDIVIDSEGNAVLTGGVWGRQDLDPGPGEQWHDAGPAPDIFVIKIGPDGTFLWGKAMGGSEFAHGLRLTKDTQDCIYITGQFRATIDFDPSEGEDIHTSEGNNDMFLTKFDPAGNYGWTYRVGGPGYDFGSGIAVDADDNIFVAGGAQPGTDFDPTEGVDIQPINGEPWDIYLTRINADRSYAWTRVFGGTEYDRAHHLACDNDGSLILVGVFDSLDADFDPRESQDIHGTQGDDDPFVTKFTNQGEYLWTRTFGSDLRDECEAAAIDSQGDIYIGGYVDEGSNPDVPVDMDPSEQDDWRFPRDTDCFVTKLAADGSYLWSNVWGSDDFDRVRSIAVDACDNVVYAGLFWDGGPVDFDPTEGEDLREAIGRFDVFTSKLLPCGNGDANGDCGVGLADYEAMFSCLAGPGVEVEMPCCAFDFDFDGDVDLPDYWAFQLAFDSP